MLVKLPGGLCIDPEIVKIIFVRREPVKMGQKDLVWTVYVRTDGDLEMKLATPETEEEAITISRGAADLINKGLKGDDEEEEEEDEEEEEEEEEESEDEDEEKTDGDSDSDDSASSDDDSSSSDDD